MKTTLLTFLFSIIIFSTNAISIVNNTSKDSLKNNTENIISKPDIPKSRTKNNWNQYAIGSCFSFLFFILFLILSALENLFTNNNSLSPESALALLLSIIAAIISFVTGIIGFQKFKENKKLKGKGFLYISILMWASLVFLLIASWSSN